MDLENKARAQAEAALKEHGWLPREWDPWAGAMDGAAPVGSYSIRAYLAEGPDAPREALCRIDDWTRRDHSGDISPYLWMVGIPRPEEVPALFEGYPEATGWGEDGAIWDSILDLVTGEVIPENRAQRLLEDPVRRGRTRSGNDAQGAEQTMRAMVGTLGGMLRSGWELRADDLGDDNARIVAVATVDGDTIRCTLEPQEHSWNVSLKAQEVLVKGFLLPGHVMTPEVAAKHLAEARESEAAR